MLTGRVFITGGAGFIGRAIITRARRENWPARFTVFSRDDHKHAAMLRDFPGVTCLRGDVAGPLEHLTAAMSGHDTVIHAAANKHVDLAELNVAETIRNNVYGSDRVAHAARMAGVDCVIGISTDKACHPASTYGYTKALMERAFVEANTSATTRFALTRYGNVLSSTGSVLTVWKKMLEKDGFVTATDPDMTRFWLTADQAVDLIVQAAGVPGGTIVIPKLRAASMMDIRRWFLPEAQFVYAGLRPSEKRHEELMTPEEAARAVDRGDHFLLYPVTDPARTDSRVPYTSELCQRLTKEQFLEMIA